MARGALIALAASIFFVLYFVYGHIHMEDNLADSDDVIWSYAIRKYTRALSLTGEFLGIGHVIPLYRSIVPYMTTTKEWSNEGVTITEAPFDNVPVRIYTPQNKVHNGPSLVWIHGGGWVFNDAASDDFLIVDMARRLDVVIVSIDYRLAPEYPYPIPFDDCYKATFHFLKNAKDYDVNPERIAIGGASAGGNLAAAVALKIRNEKVSPQLTLQILVVPCLQAFDFMTPSYQENELNAFLPKYWMINYWLWYAKGFESISKLLDIASTNDHTSIEAKRSNVADFMNHDFVSRKFRDDTNYSPPAKNHGGKETWDSVKDVFLDPYFAPLMEEDLSNLPEAYIITAQYDVLRDDGIIYGKRLEKARIPVTHHNYDRAIHPVLHTFNKYDISKKCMDDLVTYLRRKL